MGNVMQLRPARETPPPPRPKRATTKRTKFPADWTPAEGERAIADEVGMSLTERREEWAHFEDYHVAHGSLMANWKSAWRTWCRNWLKFTVRRGQRATNGGGFAGIARRLSEDE